MSKNYLFIPVFILFFFVVLSPVSAQTVTPVQSPFTKRDEIKNTIKEMVEEKKLTDVFEFRKEASREAMREELKKTIEQQKKLNEQFREALKKKLETFKDEKKKEQILKIDAKIASISSRRMEKMDEALTKLNTVLSTVKTKTNALGASCNKTDVETAIATADKSIASASALIAAQAKKTYTVNVTNETTSTQSVGQTIKLLESDLRTVHKAVAQAKQDVVKAAVALRKTTKTCSKVTGMPTSKPTTVPTAIVTQAITSQPTVTIVPTLTVAPTPTAAQ